MYSIKELYRIGRGPSSSHTIGPGLAVKAFKEEHPDVKAFKIMLFGSLGATGKGHFTDKAIEEELSPFPVEFVWQPEVVLSYHPNAMRVEGFVNPKDKKATYTKLYYSVGGGAIVEDGIPPSAKHIYAENNMTEVMQVCKDEGITLVEYVERHEGPEIWDFCATIWETMQLSIENGLTSERKYLPSPIKVERKAPSIYAASLAATDPIIRNDTLASAFALAVSEENASMGVVVTSPTCGSAGVIPGVLRYAKEIYSLSDKQIGYALGVAGILGLVAKHNASLSGAEVGCQGEIGVSSSMAAGAMCYLLGGDTGQIERAAEIAMEHCLGLTCDPMGGFVIIPCIERNANAALRSIHTASYARVLHGLYRVSYDDVLKTMYETGLDMHSGYKETSEEGLSKYYTKLVAADKKKKGKDHAYDFLKDFC